MVRAKKREFEKQQQCNTFGNEKGDKKERYVKESEEGRDRWNVILVREDGKRIYCKGAGVAGTSRLSRIFC